MKKIRLLALFLVSFFVCFEVSKASCLDDFDAYYTKSPEEYGFTWVATSGKFKDKYNQDVNIKIYDSEEDDILYFYKFNINSNSWKLLACTNSEYSNSFHDQSLLDKGEEINGHSLIYSLSEMCDASVPGKDNANKLKEVYNEIRLYTDPGNDVSDIAGYFGIGVNPLGIEGIAYSRKADTAAACIGNEHFAKITSTNPKYNLNPGLLTYTVKSTYTVKLRQLLNDDITGVRSKTYYEKNPCEMQGVLRIFRIARRIIEILKIIIPIGLIIMGSIDFYKVVTSSNDGELNKSIKTLTVRIIISIVIFFIPTLVNILVNALPSKDKSDFYNCKVCFFGDEKNSSKVCDTAIETKQMIKDDKNKYYSDFRSVEKSCAQSSAYESYLNDTCSKLPDQNARDNCKTEKQYLGKYTLSCVCNNDTVNGYNEKEMIESCAKQYLPSNSSLISDKVESLMKDKYDKCVEEGKKKRETYYVKTCLDDYQAYYNSSSAIERLTSIRNGGK